MNFRIITKNHAADPEIGFFTKMNSKPIDRATAMSTAWELINKNLFLATSNLAGKALII